MYDLVAIGNPVYDEITTPYTRTDGRVLSGCSTNACLAAKRLGLDKVALIGRIGTEYRQRFIADMTRYGVELPPVPVSTQTGGFRLVYDRKGNRTLEVLGLADPIEPTAIPDECLRSKAILFGPILHEVDLALVAYVKTNSDAELFLDPQGLTRTLGTSGKIQHVSNSEVDAVIQNVGFVKPNEVEALVLTGFSAPEASTKRLVELGANVGIVTLAERGSVVYDGHVLHRIPAFSTFAKDPTGAGDVYIGAFITRYLRGGGISDSALFASAAASIKVEHTGPAFPMTRRQVLDRVTTLTRNGALTSEPARGSPHVGD